MWPMLAMAGLGLLQGAQKQKQDAANMALNAEQMRYSPWTGAQVKMQGASAENPLMAGAQGALGGYMQQQNMDQAAAQNLQADKTLENQSNVSNAQANYFNSLAAQQGPQAPGMQPSMGYNKKMPGR